MKSIRPKAVGILVKDGHILASRDTDRVKGETFYLALGGGIEFAETAEKALRREFAEETGTAIDRVEQLGVLENIFVYEGELAHEIILVFGVHAPDLESLPLSATLTALDLGVPITWVPLDGADAPIYPDGVTAIAQAWARQNRH